MLKKLNEYLLVMGIPGLLLISFLDSAAVPMAGGPDAVILLLAWQRPSLIFAIALTASLGSTLGCLVLYAIGKKGGGSILARFGPEKVERMKRRMDEQGAWAVVGAVIAPPPFPTKLGILAAGMLQMSRIRLTVAVLVGRIVRYSIVAWLGARFGSDAARILKANYPAVSLGLIAAVALVFLLRRWMRRRS